MEIRSVKNTQKTKLPLDIKNVVKKLVEDLEAGGK